MNNNTLKSVVNKARQRRYIKRGLALLCVFVLLFTMNTLKRNANTLERVPMCGYAEEHVHMPECYDGDALVCGRAEHIHTDACYQEVPGDGDEMNVQLADTPVEDLDSENLDGLLSLSEDDFALVTDDVAPAQPVSNATEAQPKAFILGEGTMVSRIIDAVGLDVSLAAIINVAVVDDATMQADAVGIEKDGDDYRIFATRDFDRAQLALVVEGDILLVDLLDGVAVRETSDAPAEIAEETAPAAPVAEEIMPVVEESPVEDSPAGEAIEERIDLPEPVQEAQDATPAAEADETGDITLTEDAQPVEGEIIETGEQPAEDEAVETGEQSADEEAAETEGELAEDEAAETEEEPAEDEAAETEEEPAEDEVTETGEQPAEDEVTETGEQSAEDEVTETGEQPAEDEASETEEQPVEGEVSETEEQTAEEDTPETEEQPIKEEATETGEQPVEDEASGTEEQSDEAEASTEEVADEGQAIYTATVDLAEVTDYPLSLNALLAGFAPENEAQAEETPEPAGEYGTEAKPNEAPAGASALSIEYDHDLLDIEAAGDDYLITPVASFASTAIVVDNGSRCELTLVNYALPEAEGAVEAEPEARVGYPAQDFEGHTRYVKVVVAAPEGAFPEGTTMAVADVEDEKTLTDIEDTVSEEFVEVKCVHAVDITFRDAEGNEIEPLMPISVVMTVDEIGQRQEAVVVHVDDAGAAEVVDSQSEAPAGETEVKVEMPATEVPEAAQPEDSEAASVGFDADSFSVYAVVITETIDTKYIDAEGATWNISVGYGPEAGIPAGATLAVQEVEGDYLEQTTELLRGKETITLARFFDITILDAEGNAVQPAQPVEVKATLAEQSEDAVKAVHFAEDGPEIIEASQDAETVSFDAASFSVYGIVYTVDFHYGVDGGTYEFTLPGGGAVGMRELAPALGLVEDTEDAVNLFVRSIENVAFSDESLVKALPVEMNMTVGALKEKYGLEAEYSAELTEAQIAELNDKVLQAPDWALVSLKPFDTEETLTVALATGETFTVTVTDAQLTRTVIAASGETYEITVTYGADAAIPEDAELKVREILPGDEAYAGYLAEARRAASGEAYADEEVEDEAEQSEQFEAEYARFFDIEIWADEQKVEPATPVTVDIVLADAPQTGEALKVVHFDEADGPVVMRTEVGEGEETAANIRFETESFSTYGVIQVPSASQQFTSDNLDDLIGKPFTLSRNGQYFKAEVDTGNSPTLLKKASGEADAGVWYVKRAKSSDIRYILYTYSVSGEELQLQFTKNEGKSGNVNLNGGGNWFEINKNDDNTYTFRGWLDGTNSFYLNYWDGSKGLAGYADPDNNDHLTIKTLSVPADDNKDYFVILKSGDTHYLVLNDGRLEKVTMENATEFKTGNEPMMWKFANEDGNHYLMHNSFARTVEQTQKYATSWYYSYINPNNEQYGFVNEEVMTPFDKDKVADEYRKDHPDASSEAVEAYVADKKAAFEQDLRAKDGDNAVIKADSRIVIAKNGDKNYIRSATTNNYIGIQGTGDDAKMIGGVGSDQAVEVYFATRKNIEQIVAKNSASDQARKNVVDHIDIGIDAKAQLHIPLAPQKYYDKQGNVILDLDRPQMLRVEQTVPVTEQDIKNAKLTAYHRGANGAKEEIDDVYYITGYSGNAKTEISAAQVRIEGQFKVATVPDWEHNNPFDGDEQYRKDRLSDQYRVYYNVVVQKEVQFDLKTEGGIQLYDAAGHKLTSSALVELSASFDYWSPDNECPGLHTGWVVNGDNYLQPEYDVDEYGPDGWQKQNYLGWLGSDGKPQGSIPHGAGAVSGMDFILGGSEDQTAVVITKFIEDENGQLIELKEEQISKVKILQKDLSDSNDPKADTDVVKDKYTERLRTYHNPMLGDVYGNSYRTIGGTRTITVGQDGFGTIYDYDVPTGMVGVEELKKSDGGFPETVVDRNGKTWRYSHTYISTDYVSRASGDTQDKYHYTKDYTDSDETYRSVPEVLGPYHMDDDTAENSDFLEFYIHNVYVPDKISVEVEKSWEQEGNPNYTPPADSQVEVYLGRYKLVSDADFTWGDDRPRASVEIYQTNQGHQTWFINTTDFRVGDELTVLFTRQYNEPVSYSVNGGETVTLPVYEWANRPDGQDMLTHTFPVTVPETGKVEIAVDSFWGALGTPGRIVVKKGDKEYTSIDSGNAPSTSSDDSDKKYVVDQEEVSGVMQNLEFGHITLNSTSGWKGALDNLDAYDTKGNLYKYFIIREVPNDKVPAGTMPIVGTASDGTVLTSSGGDDALTLTNKVPHFSITIQKKDDKNVSIPGAEFELCKLIRGTWETVESNIRVDETNAQATVSSLFAGRYRLTEARAPEHHVIRNRDIYFIIGTDGQAYLTDRYGSNVTDVIYHNLINVSSNMFDVKNEPGGGLEINKTLVEGCDGEDVDFTFDVTLKNSDDTPYQGYVTVTDKDRTAVVTEVTDGTLAVTVTGAGKATIDGLPVGAKYAVAENDVAGWLKCGEVGTTGTIAENEMSSATITNAQPGALKLTKAVKVNGEAPTNANATKTDGTYVFTIAGLAGNANTSGITRTVSIEFEGGNIKSAEIDDIVANVEKTAEGEGYVIISNLVPGLYEITEETPTNGTVLTGVVNGAGDPKTAANVRVTAGDTTAAQTTAQATFTNTFYQVDVKIIKIDQTSRQNGEGGYVTLPGAQFKLIRGEENSEHVVEYKSVYKYANDSDAIETSNDSGELTFSNLPDGCYRIEETKVPDGYIRTENPYIYFRLEKGALTWTDADGNPLSDDNGGLVTCEKADRTFTVGNNPGAKLPNTGGSGTTPYYVFGSLLALVAAAMLVARRRGRA